MIKHLTEGFEPITKKLTEVEKTTEKLGEVLE